MAQKIDVAFAETARRDLWEILEYIQIESPRASKKIIREFYDRLKKIASFPKAGRMIPEMNEPSLREILVGSYRLMYRLEEKRAVVLRVLHGKRLFPEEI